MTPRIVDGFQIVQSNMTQAVGSRRISLLLRSSLAGAFVEQAGMDVDVCLLLQQLVFPGHFQCMAVWSMIRITRHSISSAERISIVRIFMAIFSE